MKLLASDYDDTLYEKDWHITTQKNVDAIRRFIDSGNLFCLATGRSYISIKTQTNHLHIPYNYLICNNGTSIFDEKDDLIFFNPIDEILVIKLLDYLGHLPFIKKVVLNDMYGQETEKHREVTEVVCTCDFANVIEMRKFSKEIDFLSNIHFLNVFVYKKEFDKKDGIEIVANREKIAHEDIYTIGDGRNDIGMIKAYNGHRVLGSHPSLLKCNVPIATVCSLVKKIESERK